MPTPDPYLLADLCWDFEDALRRGQSPCFDEFLERAPPGPTRNQVFVNLSQIMADCHGWTLDDVDAHLAAHQSRFPLGETRVGLYRAYYTSRLDAGKPLNWSVFAQRNIPADHLKLRYVEDWTDHYLGEIVADRYQLIQRRAAGQFGVVFRAQEIADGGYVALKVPQGESPRDRQRAVRLMAIEARNMKRLREPAIPRLHEFTQLGEHDAILAMDLIEGPNLQQLLAQGPIPARSAVSLLVPVVRALAQAHREGVFHRDLSPANILVDAHGRGWLADFGLSLTTDESWGRDGEFAGTAPYLPTELLFGQVPRIDGRSDLYSIGILLYEMLHGVRPFDGVSREDALVASIVWSDHGPPISKNVPPMIGKVCHRCLKRDPDLRYDSAEDLLEELVSFLAQAES